MHTFRTYIFAKAYTRCSAVCLRQLAYFLETTTTTMYMDAGKIPATARAQYKVNKNSGHRLPHTDMAAGMSIARHIYATGALQLKISLAGSQ